jgi:hypothetical protein
MRFAIGVGLIAAGVVIGAYASIHWREGRAATAAVLEAQALASAPARTPATTPPPARVERADRAPLPPDQGLRRGEGGPQRGAGANAEIAAVAHMPFPLAAPSAAGGAAADQQLLTRELQRALRRARCYDGPVNGQWTPATKRAMSAFTERANATLPVDKPDIVLLALLQSEQGAACGSCPEGQQLAEHGSCLPAAIMARARKAAEPPVAHTRHALAAAGRAGDAAPSAPPIAGRMGIGGPKIAALEGARVRAGTSPATPVAGEPQVMAPAKERHASGHRAHHQARPMRGYRGLARLLFGGWRF